MPLTLSTSDFSSFSTPTDRTERAILSLPMFSEVTGCCLAFEAINQLDVTAVSRCRLEEKRRNRVRHLSPRESDRLLKPLHQGVSRTSSLKSSRIAATQNRHEELESERTILLEGPVVPVLLLNSIENSLCIGLYTNHFCRNKGATKVVLAGNSMRNSTSICRVPKE